MPGRALKQKLDRETLHHLYWELDLTQAEIGRRLGISQNTVRRYLSLHDIPSKPKGVTGEQNPRARLTAEQVREIKRLLLQGETLDRIARRYAVSPSTIESIAIGRTWRHIPNPY